jgi:hypothetical protein
MTLLIHHVEILKPQSPVVNRQSCSSTLQFAVCWFSLKWQESALR